MKIKRIVSLILAALMMASLCVFVMGCASSEEDEITLEYKKSECEARIDTILQGNKQELYNEYLQASGNDAVSLTPRYELMYELAAKYMEEIAEQYKLQIKAIENEEDFNENSLAICIKLGKYFNDNMMNYKKIDWLSYVNRSPTIKTKTDDGIEYELKSSYMPLSSYNEYYIEFSSVDKELEAEFCVKAYEDGIEKECRKTIQVGDLFRLDSDFQCDSGYMEISIAVRKKAEIVGYTLLLGEDLGSLDVKKSVAIALDSRNSVDENNVGEYLGNYNVESEKRDGVKLIASEVEYKLGYCVSEIYSTMELKQVFDEAGSIYNEIEFDLTHETVDNTFECWLDEGTVTVDGESVERAIINRDKKRTLRWAAGERVTLNIVEKRNSEILSYVLIGTKILEEKVFVNKEKQPFDLISLSLYNFFTEEEYKINTEQHLNSYIKTIKNYYERTDK